MSNLLQFHVATINSEIIKILNDTFVNYFDQHKYRHTQVQTRTPTVLEQSRLSKIQRHIR